MRGTVAEEQSPIQNSGTAGTSDPGSHNRLCPSARCEDGAILLGIVGSDGRIAYVTPQVRIDASFVDKAHRGRLPERRFRFSSACIEDQCRHWTGVRCQVIDHALMVADEVVPAENQTAPKCSIRPDCRWFSQEGPEACQVCPFVITGVWIDDAPEAAKLLDRGN